jgi:hypothetical protein
MDLTPSIRNDRIYTTLFEKALNLYLYIPPHSAHPPGVLSGLILGMIFRIYSLCTNPADAHMRVKTFYNCVLARGYKPTAIYSLFQKAYNKLQDKANQTVTVKTDLTNTILFHLQYHPNDPPSSVLQRAWRENVFSPPHCKRLPNISNKAGMKIG